MASNVSLKKMIRAFAVYAAFIPAFVLPAEALPTNPTKAEGDVRAASNYRIVTYCVDKKLKGDCEAQEILLSNPMPAGVAKEGYEIGGECKNLSVKL